MTYIYNISRGGSRKLTWEGGGRGISGSATDELFFLFSLFTAYMREKFQIFTYQMLKNFDMRMCRLLVFSMLVNDHGDFDDY